MVFKLQITVVFIWTTLWFSVRGSGSDSAEEGDGIRLICSDEGLHPPVVERTENGSNKSVDSETIEEEQNNNTETSSYPDGTEHFGRYTCRAQHQNNTLTEVDIYVEKPVKALNLTCTADSVPPSVTTWTQNNSVLQNDSSSVTVTIWNLTANSSEQYTCTAKPTTNTEDKGEHSRTVHSKPEITGTTAVKEDESLNLTCSAEGFPLITWTKVGSTKNLSSRTHPSVKNSATLFISNMSAEDSGQYICRAKHLNTTVDVNVTVILRPKILESSGCSYHLEILTCTCIIQGDPLLTIKWPLLYKYSSYKIFSTVVPNTVNNTFILSVKNHNTTVQCVYSNEFWDLTKQLTVKTNGEEEDPTMKMFRRIIQLEIILAFLIGILLSACICCLTRRCCRREHKDSGYLAETLEMVASQQDPLVDPEVVEENQSLHHPEGEAEEADKADIEYSDIDFSVLPRNGAMAADHVENTTNTDYAEIKKDKRREEMIEGEEEEMMEGEEETNHRPTEEEDEEAALYSSVKDVMDQM